MRLKTLEIYHENRYSANPTSGKYTGKVEFFNDKGAGIVINLNEDQLAGIVDLCSAAIVEAAQDAAKSIVASINQQLQIEAA